VGEELTAHIWSHVWLPRNNGHTCSSPRWSATGV